MDYFIMDQLLKEISEWPTRSEYWAIKSKENPPNHRSNKRRDRRPLIIFGHGARLQIDRGTLFVKNGFTHYPQKQEEFRYFRGDPHLPNRIIVIDASGSITFDVLEWLNDQDIPLIHLNWQGNVICVANSNYSADPKLVKAQYKSLENGDARRQFQDLIVSVGPESS
jgi:CRISP-associated protein Cas1